MNLTGFLNFPLSGACHVSGTWVQEQGGERGEERERRGGNQGDSWAGDVKWDQGISSGRWERRILSLVKGEDTSWFEFEGLEVR